MKLVKKLLVLFITVLISFGFALNAFAAPSFVIKGNGTEEQGIIPPTDNYYIYHTPYTESDGFPNADFQKGLMYWTQGQKDRAIDSVELVEEDGNKFVTFTAKDRHDGIYSIRFADSRVKVGDTLAVMYDWRGEDPAFQIALNQHIMNKDESSVSMIRLSQDAGDVTNIKIASREGEWNTSMSNVNEVVKEPNLGNPTIYLSYIVQVKNDITCNAQIDNLRVVVYNKDTGNIYDLDHKKLFNIYELGNDEVDDTIDKSDFENIDYDAKPDNIKADEKGKDNDKTFIQKYSGAIIGGGIAVVVVAAAVVTVILLKKKAPKGETDNL